VSKDKKDKEKLNITDVLQVDGVKANGFGIIPKLAMQDSRLTIEAKAIYSYFCSFAGAGSTAFPSVKKICFDLNISEDRYYKHFAILKRYDYVRVKQIVDNGRFSHNIYTLVEKPFPCFAGTEIPEPEIPSPRNKGSNNNSIKNNIFKINSQSVSDDKKDRLTESEKDIINNILDKSGYKLFSDNDQPVLKIALESLYYDNNFAKKQGISIEKMREYLNYIKPQSIGYALNNYKDANHIENDNKPKNKKAYFMKVLYNSIIESRLNVMF